jgi:maltose/moltooligosaccharide transporter
MQSPSIKPRLSFWQLWNMSFGFFGIQFGFALQNTNTSRIFATLGASPDDLPLFWLAAPVTGLLVQPIIGYLSDNTWHPRWGRRRPFFFVGAVLASLALFLMPNSSALWMAIAILWLMDAAINVSMEPFRAFVGDKLDSSQQTTGFAMQTFFIGCGAVIASLLPYLFADVLGVSNVPVNGAIPDSVRYSFYAGGAAYFLAVMWTVLTADEIPPENLEAFRAESKPGVSHAIIEILGGFMSMPKTMVQLAFVQFFTWVALFAMWIYTTNAVADNVFGTADAQSAAFQEAGNWVGIMFAVYNGVSALAAFILPMIGVGIAWASILTMPYAILAGALPPKRMGFYMGVFNFFIVIPQIVSGLLLGFVTKHFFSGHTVSTVALGGASMVLAGLLTMFVHEHGAKRAALPDGADGAAKQPS